MTEQHNAFGGEVEETEQVRLRYARRHDVNRYSLLNPYQLLALQERERALARWMSISSITPAECRLLEVGCGTGGNLLTFLHFGFRAENLIGNELLEDRCKRARNLLPEALRIIPGDACDLDFGEGAFNVVFQSTVFSSLLNPGFRQKLAARMWQLTKPGGGVLWYDFTYDNPGNKDVRGVTWKAAQGLFPGATNIKRWRITLAPPIGRRLVRVHPLMYSLFNALPFLRTHILCWFQKPV